METVRLKVKHFCPLLLFSFLHNLFYSNKQLKNWFQIFYFIMSSTEFTFSDSTSIAPIRKKNVGGRPKSIVWETHAKQGKKISQGHYEATCIYCDFFWRKGSP